MKKSKFIFILIDAFRNDYLNSSDTPFMYSLKNKSIFYENIKPSFGFCERAELFTGKKSLELGLLTAINFSNSSPYKYLKIINFFAFYMFKIFRFPVFEKIYRILIWKFSKILQRPMFPQNIPLNKLHLFDLTEDKNKYNDLNNFNSKTIFDLCFEKKISYNIIPFTSLNFSKNYSENIRIEKFINGLDSHDISLLYIDGADRVGHKYGPKSIQIKQISSEIDQKIKNIYEHINRKYKEYEILIVGDHGMEEVEHHHDVLSILEKLFMSHNLNLNKEIELFLESTILRIFIKNKNHFHKINNILKNNNFFNSYGKFISSDDINDDLNTLNKYGDIIWWINKKHVISPSYFTKGEAKYKGMHGYYELDTSKGLALYIQSSLKLYKIIKNSNLNELFKHFKNYIDSND